MSAVKNLRAMFEQKGEASSPPDRVSGSDSPRPLSKIRTNFVAVEKDGRVGLVREGSQDSASVLKKRNGDSNVTTPTAGADKQNPFDLLPKSPDKMGVQAQSNPGSPPPNAGATDISPLAPAAEISKSSPAPAATPESTTAQTNGSEEPAQADRADTQQAELSNGAASEKEAHKKAAKDASERSASRSTRTTPKPFTTASANKSATKRDRSPKAPATPAAASSQARAARKTPERTANTSEQTATPRGTPVSKPSAPSSVKRPPPLQSSPASAGLVKPKVRSPTRPVKLSSSLTTHTAASESKINAPRQPLPRTSATNLASEARGRPTSRASISTASSALNKSISAGGSKRQSSTVGRPQPSLGPPPKQPAKDHPPPRKEREVDQSFLERMTRPTAASASKMASKVNNTPPRKAVAASQKTSTAKPVKRAVSKPADSNSSLSGGQAAAAGNATAPENTAKETKPAEGDVISPAGAGENNSAQAAATAAEQGEAAGEATAASQADDDKSAQPQDADDDNQTAKESGAEEPAKTDDGADKAAAAAPEENAAASPNGDAEPATAEKQDDLETAAA
ncbi:hypothetical protein VTH06DRAFT_4813 [Thermothelomyces fergusii]